MLRIVVASTGALFDLGARFAQWFAHFLCDENRVSVTLCLQLHRYIARHFCTLRKNCLRPGLLCVVGFFQSLFQTLNIQTGMGLNHFIGGGVETHKGHGGYPMIICDAP